MQHGNKANVLEGLKVNMQRTIIFAKDMQKMTAFYRDVLGLNPTPSEEPGEWLAFDAGGIQIALHAIPAPFRKGIEIDDPPRPRSSNPTKMVFHVEDLEQARETLLAQNVPMLEHPNLKEPGASIRADFLDPEGNIFQLSIR